MLKQPTCWLFTNSFSYSLAINRQLGITSYVLRFVSYLWHRHVCSIYDDQDDEDTCEVVFLCTEQRLQTLDKWLLWNSIV